MNIWMSMLRWNKDFPIPLDIENGRRLINDWLIQAEKSRHQSALEKKRKLKHLSEFTSDNYFNYQTVVSM